MNIQFRYIVTFILFIFSRAYLSAQTSLFNDRWLFHKGDLPGVEQAMNDTAGWHSVTLPHDWSIEGPFSEQWASATAFLPGGIGWYEKAFTVPGDWKNKNIFIYFDGVYKNSTIWLNGHYLGNRPNGFIPFEYELTKYLNIGGKNILTVKADHSEFADSRWYTGSGIYRNVYLIVKNPVHIAKWGVQFSTPQVSRSKAVANIKVWLQNQSSKTTSVVLQAALKDPGGSIAARISRRMVIRSGDSIPSLLELNIPHPQLWSVDNPVLYNLDISIVSKGKISDSYNEKVGIRSIHIDADSGFFLNDKNIKLKGVCLHDDAGALGVAVPEAVWRRRLKLLKALGCNSVRMSHNPHADYMYKLCDEMGFLVLDEAFDEWEMGKNKWIKGWNAGTPGKDGYHEYFAQWADIDLRDMILRNYNHPSIIAWSIGNEIDYPNDPYTSEVLNKGNNPQIYGKGYSKDHPSAQRLGVLSRQLAAVVKANDTTRPVTAALAGVAMSNTTSYPDNLDWVGYNYQEYRYAEDHAAYPKRKIYGSENGTSLQAWNAVDSNQYIPAQYLWTGVDYLGEAGRWPERSNRAGLIDLAGFPKPEYYFRQSLWSSKPMIYIGAARLSERAGKGIWSQKNAMPAWNWANNEELQISCFTNCPKAELFLNGVSLGKKSLAAFPDHVITWQVAYAPGKLKVIGYNNGIAAAQYTLQTAGAPALIHATVEKDTAGKTNLVHLMMSITDKDGIVVNNADNEITVQVNGHARLLGLESGSSTSHEDYQSDKRKAYNGKLVAYIKDDDDADIEISSPGLTTQHIHL